MIDKIMTLNKEGFTNKEIAEKVSTEDKPFTYQAIAKVIRDNAQEIAVVDDSIRVFTTTEYQKYSTDNGRSRYGGELGLEVAISSEELRAYISSGFPPSEVMEKNQMSQDSLKQAVDLLSRKELRDKPILVNFKNDFFRG